MSGSNTKPEGRRTSLKIMPGSSPWNVQTGGLDPRRFAPSTLIVSLASGQREQGLSDRLACRFIHAQRRVMGGLSRRGVLRRLR